jgi:hypothetical protein
MAEMGKYCKAYLLKQFREFPGWTENTANTRKEKKEVDGKEIEEQRQLDDESILYLQENYVVTDDIFKDQNIIFDNVTDEWKEYCHGPLAFEIPVYEPINIPVANAETPASTDTPATPADAEPVAAGGESGSNG